MTWHCGDCGELFYVDLVASLPNACPKCHGMHFQSWSPNQTGGESPPEAVLEMKWFCSNCGWEFLLVLGATLPGECPKCHEFRFQSWAPRERAAQ